MRYTGINGGILRTNENTQGKDQKVIMHHRSRSWIVGGYNVRKNTSYGRRGRCRAFAEKGIAALGI
jgi:hypothetical protein